MARVFERWLVMGGLVSSECAINAPLPRRPLVRLGSVSPSLLGNRKFRKFARCHQPPPFFLLSHTRQAWTIR